MLKRLLSLGLLCLAFDSHASITVTTTADTSGTSACSLRDAVAMVNSGTLTKSIGGCVDTDTTTTIVLNESTTYTLNSQLTISSSVTLQGNADSTNNTDGSLNSTIQLMGSVPVLIGGVSTNQNRIFDIEPPQSTSTSNTNSDSATTTVTLTITNVNLIGCIGTTNCTPVAQGGVIFNNNGAVSLSSLRISKGTAVSGGGVYTTKAGTSAFTTVEMMNNTAQQGAAIYNETPTFSITGSLFDNNAIANVTGTAANSGFVIYTLSPPATTSTTSTSSSTGLVSSTIYNNTASGINILQGVTVNNATIVNNQGGVTLNAATGGILANSIVAGNNNGGSGTDCTFVSGDLTPINNIVYISGCEETQATAGLVASTQLSNTGDQTLMAQSASNGKCALPELVVDSQNPLTVHTAPAAEGLLCPFSTYSGQFNGYLLPRLLLSYTSLTQAPIVNRGNQSGGTLCSSTDQRGDSRTLCDIGAIELVIPTGNAQTNGEDILYGQTATIDFSPVVGDGQIIPSSQCQTVMSLLAIRNQTALPAAGTAWQDGCLTYVTPPSLGTAVLSALNENMVYTPSSDWQGIDKFNYNIVTTTSFWSDAVNDQEINVETTIKQDPPTGITSKTVGAGSLDIFGIFALMGLVATRRRLTGGRS